MNFQRGHGREEPEINLIPMIDVLLVIIIFLMLTTTYAKFSGLEINLPTADAAKKNEQPSDIGMIAEGLRRAAGGNADPLIIINADAKATHQSVVDVMQAAQSAGYPHISFATQNR